MNMIVNFATKSASAKARKIKALLDKVEEHHLKALDLADEALENKSTGRAAISEIRMELYKARAQADAATLLADELHKEPGTSNNADEERSFHPARRKASLAALDAADVGRAAHQSAAEPRDLGGAFVTSRFRHEEEQRLKRFWGL
jgi:hypothetical protein